MKSINIQNLKVGGENVTTEAEVPSELSDLTKDVSGDKNLEALKVIAGNGISFINQGDYVEIAKGIDKYNVMTLDKITFKADLDDAYLDMTGIAYEDTDLANGYIKGAIYKVVNDDILGYVWKCISDSVMLSVEQMKEFATYGVDCLKHFYSEAEISNNTSFICYDGSSSLGYRAGIYKLDLERDKTSGIPIKAVWAGKIQWEDISNIIAMLPFSEDISGGNS